MTEVIAIGAGVAVAFGALVWKISQNGARAYKEAHKQIQDIRCEYVSISLCNERGRVNLRELEGIKSDFKEMKGDIREIRTDIKELLKKNGL